MMFLRWERKKGRKKGWRDEEKEIGGLKGRRHRQKRHTHRWGDKYCIVSNGEIERKTDCQWE